MTNHEKARALQMEIWDAPNHYAGVSLILAFAAEVRRVEEFEDGRFERAALELAKGGGG